MVGIDNFATGRRETPQDHPNLTFVEGSIADHALVNQLIGDLQPDAVVHTAASYKGSRRLVQRYADQLRRRFERRSSGEEEQCRPLRVFPDRPVLRRQADPAAGAPGSSAQPGQQQLCDLQVGERGLSGYSGLDFVTFRLANVVGPRNVSGPLPIFFQRLSEGKKCFVTKARRDFVFVKDLARATVRAVGGVGHGAYHSRRAPTSPSGTVRRRRRGHGSAVLSGTEIRELGPDDAPIDPAGSVAHHQDFGKIEFTPLKETVAAAVAYFRGMVFRVATPI